MMLAEAAEAAEAAASGTDLTLSTVLSLLGGGALVTALAGFIGRAWEARREHRSWLREQRYEAYQDALLLFSFFRDDAKDRRGEEEEDADPADSVVTDLGRQDRVTYEKLRDQRYEAERKIDLVASRRVKEQFGRALASLMTGDDDVILQAELRLGEAMRFSLGVQRDGFRSRARAVLRALVNR